MQNDETMDDVENILNMLFGIVIPIIMFLCFFSLSSSMTANIYEQNKEIAIMRAIGFTKSVVARLYIYEAFILVSASSVLGVFIGVIIGYIMTMQRVLFI